MNRGNVKRRKWDVKGKKSEKKGMRWEKKREKNIETHKDVLFNRNFRV
jgi:hypothetical protein